MKVFVTGATGFIGGSVAAALVGEGHDVSGLTRWDVGAASLAAHMISPVSGTLDDLDVLTRAAHAADAVIHCADSDHAASARALVDALAGTGKRLLHTSGSSIVGTQAMGHLLEPIYDENTAFTPSPGRAARAALTEEIRSAHKHGVHTCVIAPSLIYGQGRIDRRESMQIPWLLRTARRHGVARHLGPGQNRWSNVHIDDLVDLYLRALAHAPEGAFYWAENGENAMAELCASINRMMQIDGPTQAMTPEEAAVEWGEGPAINTMGSNSRVRAVRARQELGWAPSGPSAIEEIETGHYARTQA